MNYAPRKYTHAPQSFLPVLNPLNQRFARIDQNYSFKNSLRRDGKSPDISKSQNAHSLNRQKYSISPQRIKDLTNNRYILDKPYTKIAPDSSSDKETSTNRKEIKISKSKKLDSLPVLYRHPAKQYNVSNSIQEIQSSNQNSIKKTQAVLTSSNALSVNRNITN